MNDKNFKPILIIAAFILLILMATHTEELNRIPGVETSGGGWSVDIGDYHYEQEGN